MVQIGRHIKNHKMVKYMSWRYAVIDACECNKKGEKKTENIHITIKNPRLEDKSLNINRSIFV